MPGKGLVKSGTKKGAQFKTPACPRIDMNDPPHYFKNEFGYGVPVYWMGSYVDLEMEEIEIEVSHRHGHHDRMHALTTARVPVAPHRCSRASRRRRARSGAGRSSPSCSMQVLTTAHPLPHRCGEKLSLLQLAQGSVMKEFVLKDEKKDGGGSESAKAGGAHHGALFRVSFVVYFEELFVFQLRFVEWKGVGLIAADTPKKMKRSAKSEELEAKRKAKIEAAREAFKLRLELKRKQKVRSRRTRVRE